MAAAEEGEESKHLEQDADHETAIVTGSEPKDQLLGCRVLAKDKRFRHVTLRVIKPVLIIVTMFSVIFTFSDFQLPYVLTHGGPANATHLFATFAFDICMSGRPLGSGAPSRCRCCPRSRS